MKTLVYILLSASLVACAGRRLTADKYYLQSPEEGNSRLLIYSVFPESMSERGDYLSVLLLVNKKNEVSSADAHIRFYTNDYYEAFAARHYFEDSLIDLDETHFPLAFISHAQLAGEPIFAHSLSPQGIKCAARDSTYGTTSIQLRFPRGVDFSSVHFTEPFGIHQIPVVRDVKFEFDTDYRQNKSMCMLFTLDSLNSLFKTRKKTTYYWLNYSFENTMQTLFFSFDQATGFVPYLNTLPEDVRVNVLSSFPAEKPLPQNAAQFIELDIHGATYTIDPFGFNEYDYGDKPLFSMGFVHVVDKSSRERLSVGNLFVL
jgi:hypothetical protein